MSYFIYALQFLFIGLKLTDYIDWSWWFVLLPLIILGVINFIAIVIISYQYVKASPLEKTLLDIHRGKFK